VSLSEQMAMLDHARFEQQSHFVNALPLTENGLLIREISVGDVPGFHEIATHLGFSYYCFDGSRESTERFVHAAISTQRCGSEAMRESFMLAVEEVSTHKVVGHVSADVLDKDPEHFDLAYFTHPKYQRHGIAQNAATALLRQLFSSFDINAIVATVHPENYPSLKVLSRIGFKSTGKTTKVESANGKNDRLCFCLTRKQFETAHPIIKALSL